MRRDPVRGLGENLDGGSLSQPYSNPIIEAMRDQGKLFFNERCRGRFVGLALRESREM